MMSHNEDVLISVVVPVYNVEPYLKRCMNSLLGQSYQNVEIILVDDGSTDQSGQLCDAYASEYERVSVIHKQNAGLGMARNTGLENCHGDYVAFIDSDDFIEPDMLEKQLQAIMEFDAKACYCSYDNYSNEDKKAIPSDNIPSVYYTKEKTCRTGLEILFDMIGSEPEDELDFRHTMSACMILYSMDVIRKHDLRFESERRLISEDLVFASEFLKHAEKIADLPDPFYHYCANTHSVSRRYNPERFKREKYFYCEMRKRLEKVFRNTGFEKRWRRRFRRFYLGRIRMVIIQDILSSGQSLWKLRSDLKQIVYDPTVTQALAKYPVKRLPFRQRIFNIAMKYKLLFVMYILVKARDKT